MRKNTAADFWVKVTKTNACWLWTGRVDANGYGHWDIDGKCISAHRFAYQDVYGQVPASLQLDHTCHNEDAKCKGGKTCLHRRCVRPDHLLPSTSQENVSRAKRKIIMCPQGHLYTQQNTMLYQGRRYCRACIAERTAAADKRNKRWLNRVEYLREWRRKKREALL